MRSSTSLAALALALLHSTSAMNTAMQRQFNLLADMGYNPDGTPMALSDDTTTTTSDNSPIDKSLLTSLKISASSKDASLAAPSPPETITAEYVTLPLDNFARSKGQSDAYYGTFNNRYWVAESGYRPGGPVFVYDVGEANAAGNALFRLQNETSFFKQLVDEFGGVGVVWEHRFCEFNFIHLLRGWWMRG